jgi:imidazolonepropionase-like amidohydrolase
MDTLKRLLVLAVGLFFAASFAAADVLPTYAIVNCRIVPVTSPPIEKGAIIIRDGLIESIGAIEKVKIPDDAEVIDAAGLIAYPGLISAHTNLFLEPRREARTEEGSAAPAPQAREAAASKPGTRAFDLIKPKLDAIESCHRLGVTTVLVAPNAGIFAGQSVLLNLNGEKPEPLVVKNPVALHVQFVTERGAYPSSLMGTMAFLRQSFLDAKYYASYKVQAAKTPKGLKRPEYNPFLEDLTPFVVDKKPIIFTCNNQEDIKRALRLREEFKLNAMISGANEAWRVTDLLIMAQIPLFVSLDFRPPLTSEYSQKGEEEQKSAEKEIYPANPNALSKAGIKFALTTLGLSDIGSLPKNLQAALEAGLPREEALRDMTITPAQFLGVDDLLGSLEPGKIANVVLAGGEPFAEKAVVERVFVDGILFKLEKKTPEAKPGTPAGRDLGGSWQATIKSQMGDMDVNLELKQDGNQIKGTMDNQMGKWEIRDGVLSGDDLSFVIEAIIMGESMEMTFSGKAGRDLIEGTISTAMGAAELRATRIPKGLGERGTL